MDILLTGCAVTPEEALRIGMITCVVPDGEAVAGRS
jgi:enoyl-CoA hydratase/carnithine racemase